MVRVRLCVWLVCGYAHVFVLVSVASEHYPSQTLYVGSANVRRSITVVTENIKKIRCK